MLPDFLHLASLAPLGLVAAAVLLAPGLLVLLPLGTPLPTAVALAPAVGLASLSLTSIAMAALDIPWSLAAAVGGSLVGFVIAWLIGRRYRFVQDHTPRPGWLLLVVLLAAVLGSSLLTLVALYRGMESVGTASQGWDPIFHMNAVQWIRESGEATPWSVTPIFSSNTNYYPVGWHLVASLIPGDVVQASNISTLVIGAVLWPISVSYLASVVFPHRRVVWLLAPVLAASYISFPYAQLMRSGQWPNGLGTALAPACLAILIVALRLLFRPDHEPHQVRPVRYREVLTTVLIAVVALVGTAAAHPGALMAVAVAALPFAIAYSFPWLVSIHRRHAREGAIWLLAGAGALALGIAVLSQSRLLEGVMRYDRSVRAELPESIHFAVFDLATFPVLQAPNVEEFNTYVGLLAVAGALLALLRKGHRALAVAWLAFVSLHILAAGPENPARWLTGFWYKDTQRIAPMVAMTGALLAGLTIDMLTRTVIGLIRRVPGSVAAPVPRVQPHQIASVISLTLVATIYVASDNFRAAERIAVTARNYSVDSNGMGVLAAGEQNFIERAAGLLPDDAIVVGDPFNGETYFYTLAQRRVVYTQLGSATSGHEAKEYLRTAFNQIHTDPSVCRALHSLGVTHFYEDEPGISHASDGLEDWPGFYGTDTTRGFEVVLTEGSHTLYRITAC